MRQAQTDTTDPAEYNPFNDLQQEIVADMLRRLREIGFHFVRPVQVEYVPGCWDHAHYQHSEWRYTVQLYDALNLKNYGMWTGTYIEFVYLLERLGKK